MELANFVEAVEGQMAQAAELWQVQLKKAGAALSTARSTVLLVLPPVVQWRHHQLRERLWQPAWPIWQHYLLNEATCQSHVAARPCQQEW